MLEPRTRQAAPVPATISVRLPRETNGQLHSLMERLNMTVTELIIALIDQEHEEQMTHGHS